MLEKFYSNLVYMVPDGAPQLIDYGSDAMEHVKYKQVSYQCIVSFKNRGGGMVHFYYPEYIGQDDLIMRALMKYADSSAPKEEPWISRTFD